MVPTLGASTPSMDERMWSVLPELALALAGHEEEKGNRKRKGPIDRGFLRKVDLQSELYYSGKKFKEIVDMKNLSELSESHNRISSD